MKTKDITADDYSRYEWIDVGGGIFIRGYEKTAPPDDGFVYVDVTKFGDAKQVWARAQEKA